MSKSPQLSIGDQGEAWALNILNSKGVEFLRQIETPNALIPAGTIDGKKAFHVIYSENVAGDIRGVLPDGTSVLAEVKTRTSSTRLVWSDFEDHQPGTLSEHAQWGLSLVVWICEHGIHVMRWPIPGLDGPRDGIGEEEVLAAEWKGVR